jgi:hypothetical protein
MQGPPTLCRGSLFYGTFGFWHYVLTSFNCLGCMGIRFGLRKCITLPASKMCFPTLLALELRRSMNKIVKKNLVHKFLARCSYARRRRTTSFHFWLATRKKKKKKKKKRRETFPLDDRVPRLFCSNLLSFCFGNRTKMDA